MTTMTADDMDYLIAQGTRIHWLRAALHVLAADQSQPTVRAIALLALCRDNERRTQCNEVTK